MLILKQFPTFGILGIRFRLSVLMGDFFDAQKVLRVVNDRFRLYCASLARIKQN